jgi:hypothetical protein
MPPTKLIEIIDDSFYSLFPKDVASRTRLYTAAVTNDDEQRDLLEDRLGLCKLISLLET